MDMLYASKNMIGCYYSAGSQAIDEWASEQTEKQLIQSGNVSASSVLCLISCYAAVRWMIICY